MEIRGNRRIPSSGTGWSYGRGHRPKNVSIWRFWRRSTTIQPGNLLFRLQVLDVALPEHNCKFSYTLSTNLVQGDPPQWRDFHTAVALGSKMYVFGGRSDQMGQYHSTRDTYCQQLKVLDVTTKKWTLLPPSGERTPSGRRSHSACKLFFLYFKNLVSGTYNGKMYMFGGFNGTMSTHYDELWCYDPDLNKWTKMNPIALATPPCARRRQCTVVVGHRVFLFGGTT